MTICPECQKPKTAFAKHLKHRLRCTDCQRAKQQSYNERWRANHPERYAAELKRTSEKICARLRVDPEFRERGRMASMRRYWSDPELARRRMSEYRKAHPRDAELERQRYQRDREKRLKWYRENRDRGIELGRAYRASERGKEMARRRKERFAERDRINRRTIAHARRKAPGRHTTKEWLAVLERSGYRCAYCSADLTRESASRDHMTPICRGGSNDISNITPACLPCNRRKRQRTAAEFGISKH